jgi:hypothetical protein
MTRQKEALEPNLSMDSLVIEEVMAALDIAVLERTGPYSYRLLGEIPDFFRKLYLQEVVPGESFRLWESSPFIDHFLEQAEPFWMLDSRGRLDSGPWSETDPRGEEYHLEASAMCLKNVKVLLLRNLGEEYAKKLKILQQARVDLLREGILEAEARRKNGARENG